MTKTRSTKSALISSVLALLLCSTMLLGTTFAWFTDSVTSANNVIKSGTLDVEMYWAKGTENPATANWATADGVALYTADQLWEPGYTDAKHIKIFNEGTLALKYQLAIIPTGEVSKLAEVIDVYLYEIADTDANATQVANRTDLDETMWVGTLADVIGKGIVQGNLAADTDYTTTIVLKMQEAADNEYQDLSIGDAFTIQLLATQLASEYDSFGNDYDKDASVFVSSAAELKNALANVKDGGTVYVSDGTYDIDGQLNVAGKSVNIVGVGENAVIHMTDTRVNYNKIFYIYGSADGKDVTVNISNVTLAADVATKSDIWIRTDSANDTDDTVGGNVTVNLDNVTCTSIICDNNYIDGATVNLNITNSNVKKVTLDASPYNGNGRNTYTNLKYSATRIDSISIQNGAAQALNNITINGVNPAATGEQQPLTYVDTIEELQDAIDNAEENDVIVFGTNITGNVVLTNGDITIDGRDYKLDGSVNLNGKKDVTLKDITFDAAYAIRGYDGKGTAKQVALIITGDATNKPNAGAMNLVIDGCTFTGTFANGGASIAFTDQNRNSGGSGNVTIKNCTFDTVGAYYDIYAHYTGNGANGYGDFVIENNTFKTSFTQGGPVYLGRYASSTPVVVKGNTFETVASLEDGVYVQDHSSYGVSVDASGNTFAN